MERCRSLTWGFAGPVGGNTGLTQPSSGNSLDVGSGRCYFLTSQMAGVEAFKAPGKTCPCAADSAASTEAWFFLSSTAELRRWSRKLLTF